MLFEFFSLPLSNTFLLDLQKIISIFPTLLLILVLLLLLGWAISYEDYQQEHTPYKVLTNNSIGSVEKVIYGNESAPNTIALITGIHPREKLSIEPEIKATEEYVKNHEDIKIINYKVNVTKDWKDYEKGRENGECLVHDYVNPDVTISDAYCVIISHSHEDWYGEGFYLATPKMDDKSVEIAKKIKATSDFGYYPKTGNESYKSTSAVRVSCPIAEAGYPTFVYEIPENITAQNSTDWTKDLFSQMVKYAC